MMGRESSTEIASKISTTKNWKKLEQKYLDYIELLKSKISRSERKLLNEFRASSILHVAAKVSYLVQMQ
jgi:ppGpp synthetase/RelA/SpoT-type nucleotidyltranferase